MLTVSIINYRGCADTVQCIRDLALVCDQLEYRVVVRDNSEKPELEDLKTALGDLGSRVHFFTSPDNPGFARGHNLNFRALEHGEGDIFLILNPDVRLPDAGVVGAMIEYCSPAQIVSCVIETASGAGLWFAGGYCGRMTGVPTVSRKPFAEPFRRVDFVTGCCMAVSAALYSRLGGFDESYFMYSEDVDLCLRARSSGASVGVVNRRIVHRVGSGEKGSYSDLYLYEGTRNRLLCMRRHRLGIPALGVAYILFKHGILRTLQLAVYSKHPLRQTLAAWRGIVDGLGRENIRHAHI